jgi:hypothetical protein
LYSPERIQRFKDGHKGGTLFCIGSGPSLREENLSLLNGQDVIFVNGSFKLLEQIKVRHSYWIVQDFKNLERFRDVDRRLFKASFRSVHQWTHSWFRPPFDKDDIILMPVITISRYGWPVIQDPGPHLSWDVSETIGMTPTVIFTAIQVAIYMGAARVALLGVDLDYTSGSAHFYDAQQADPVQARRFETVVQPVLKHYDALLNAEQPRLFNCTCRTNDKILPKLSLAEMVSE